MLMYDLRRLEVRGSIPPLESVESHTMRSLSPSRIPLGAVIAALAIFTSTSYAQTITIGDTRQTTDRAVGFADNGKDGILEQRYGQTFRTPDDASTSLSTWSVWASSPFGPTASSDFIAASLRLSIVEWSGSAPVGPELFTSSPFTPVFSNSGEQEFKFTIDQALDPAKTYLALVAAVGGSTTDGQRLITNLSTVCGTACGNSDQYADGSLVLIQSRSTDAGWLPISDGPDIFEYGPQDELSFQATFNTPVTATPEPASMALVATGLASVGAMVRRRKRRLAA